MHQDAANGGHSVAAKDRRGSRGGRGRGLGTGEKYAHALMELVANQAV
jgi:hypothetical protein